MVTTQHSADYLNVRQCLEKMAGALVSGQIEVIDGTTMGGVGFSRATPAPQLRFPPKFANAGLFIEREVNAYFRARGLNRSGSKAVSFNGNNNTLSINFEDFSRALQGDNGAAIAGGLAAIAGQAGVYGPGSLSIQGAPLPNGRMLIDAYLGASEVRLSDGIRPVGAVMAVGSPEPITIVARDNGTVDTLATTRALIAEGNGSAGTGAQAAWSPPSRHK